MARNGSGTYNLPAGNPVTTGTTISSTWANNTLSDMATALTGSIAADGQTTASSNLPMGGFIHTNVGNATVRTNYASAAQVQDGGLNYLTSVSGADTITAVGAVGMTAYATGQRFTFISAGANTGAATLNINSIGAKSITKNGTTVLSAGDIASGSAVEVVYDGTEFQLTSSIPSVSVPSPGTSGNVLTSNGTAWTSAAPSSGKVLQVVSATYSTQVTSTTSTYIDTNLTATITPTSATSKILVLITDVVQIYAGSSQANGNLRIARNGTAIYTTVGAAFSLYGSAGYINGVATMSLTYLDSPATTSATTYKLQQNAVNGELYSQSSGSTSTITLMEIAA